MLSLPFRKKKEESSQDEELKEKKPRKPRKKVEPPKPWGKIERFIVFVILILAPLLSIAFFMRSKNAKNLPQAQSAPKILGNVLPEKPKDIDGLKRDLLAETKNLQGTYGIYIESLDGSYKLGINENEAFDGASLFKLPLMIVYYKNIDAGKITGDTTYTLKYSDQAAGAGILANMPPGTVINYHDIIEAMGKNSDNTAFSIMLGVLGNNSETDEIQDLGMTNTDFSQSQTTPFDINSLFFKLENNNLISASSKNEMYSFLTGTDFENLIPQGVGGSIKVIHKYAADSGELNDAGIVFVSKPYIISILSKDVNLDEANLEIPKISQIVYNYLK